MNLKHKYLLWTSCLMGLVLLLGVVSIWHLRGIWQSTRVASAEYDAMDRADATIQQVGWLRDVLRGADSRTYRDVKYFAPIKTEVLEIVRELQLAAGTDDGDGLAEKQLAKKATEHLDAANKQALVDPTAMVTATATQAAAELDLVRQSLDNVTKLIPAAARHHVAAAADRVVSRLWWTCFWLLIVLILSALIHYRQYKMLVRPLVWLRDDMQHSAGHDYKELVKLRGDGEFLDVAGYFNGLAKELAALYRGMEEKIITRSRELVRSERLASVGFLAAGVAHEINNPLSVISGYAELAAKHIRRLVDGPGDDLDPEAEAAALSHALDAQQIVRDEAFRCKEITSRLLSLARGGGDGQQPLCLDEMARHVTLLTKGLKNYRDRRVTLDFQSSDHLEVMANPTEMKQVLLNLTVNALEAVPGESGEVRIGGRRTGDWIEVYVEDNGKGMSAETLHQVFEPFFTNKRGVGEPGTGLGLSITNAIVENLGGGIRAESAGPGRGSRFTVRLPASKSPARISAAAVG
jgi:signal transduction histidine kinase